MELAEALDLLEQESSHLDAVVAPLPAEAWTTPTPAQGWTIADQIAHLHWTDVVSVQTATRDAAFDELLSRVAGPEGLTLVDSEAHRLAQTEPARLLLQWREGRAALQKALRQADPGDKIRWFGPPMRPMTMATARIMETWAHSLDVADALGVDKPATASLAAVARIGVRTRGFAFAARGIEDPGAEVRVELTLPGQPNLVFGPADAAESITGSAWGFAAVVTQRRNIADVDLTANGPTAQTWMANAQAFAGAPTSGPAPGERAGTRHTSTRHTSTQYAGTPHTGTYETGTHHEGAPTS